jgi:hypothetical protein
MAEKLLPVIKVKKMYNESEQLYIKSTGICTAGF